MFALDDLYNNTNENLVDKTSASAVNTPSESTNYFTQFLAEFEAGFWTVELNQWLLAFTVFYSLWFFLDFVFWKVIYHEGSLENEETGAESLGKGIKLWFGYFTYLGVWSVAIFNQGLIRTIFEYLALIIFVVVFVGVDLPMIPVFGKIFGGSSKSGNIFSQVGGFVVSLLTQLWQGLVEVLGLSSPPPKVDKK